MLPQMQLSQVMQAILTKQPLGGPIMQQHQLHLMFLSQIPC